MEDICFRILNELVKYRYYLNNIGVFNSQSYFGIMFFGKDIYILVYLYLYEQRFFYF